MLDAADRITDQLVTTEKLRAALTEIRRIHAPVKIGADFEVCAGCCYHDDEDRLDGLRTQACIDWHHHGDPYPICPTAAILDRVGL